MNTPMHPTTHKHISSLVQIIKEKIGLGVINIDRNEQGQVLYYEQRKVKSLSTEMLTFEDDTVLTWNNVSDLNELVNILVWIEHWLKAQEKKWISIRWSVYDFEDIAQQKEKDQNHDLGTIYDRSKFADALHLLGEKHDCNFGITWSDIDHYLDEYCKLPK